MWLYFIKGFYITRFTNKYLICSLTYTMSKILNSCFYEKKCLETNHIAADMHVDSRHKLQLVIRQLVCYDKLLIR